MDRENQILSSELSGKRFAPARSAYNGLFQKAPALWFYRCNNCPTIIPSRKIGSERGAYASNGSGMILCNPCRRLYRKWKGLRTIDGAGSFETGYSKFSATSPHPSTISGEASTATTGSRSRASASNSTLRERSAPSKPPAAGSSAASRDDKGNYGHPVGRPSPELYHAGAQLFRTRLMYQPTVQNIYPNTGESGDEYDLEAEQP